MIPSTYDGPRNGDYVTYVDRLLRANPDFRRTQNNIAGAFQSAAITPGVQADSPMAQLRNKLQQAKDMAEQLERKKTAATLTPTLTPTPARPQQRTVSAGRPTQAPTMDEAKQRFRAIEREIESQKSQAASNKGRAWVSPFSLALIVGGAVISQFVPGFGAVLSVMGFMSLIGGVFSKLKGK